MNEFIFTVSYPVKHTDSNFDILATSAKLVRYSLRNSFFILFHLGVANMNYIIQQTFSITRV